MKVKKIFAGSLLVKDKPVFLWIFSIFFMIVSIVIIAGMTGMFQNLYEIPIMQKIFTWFVSLGVFGAAIRFILSYPVTKVIFNINKGEVLLVRISMFGKVSKKFLINDIKGFIMLENYNREEEPVYRPAIKLKSNEMVNLSMLWFQQKHVVEKIVNEIEKFISTQPV